MYSSGINLTSIECSNTSNGHCLHVLLLELRKVDSLDLLHNSPEDVLVLDRLVSTFIEYCWIRRINHVHKSKDATVCFTLQVCCTFQAFGMFLTVVCPRVDDIFVMVVVITSSASVRSLHNSSTIVADSMVGSEQNAKSVICYSFRAITCIRTPRWYSCGALTRLERLESPLRSSVSFLYPQYWRRQMTSLSI